MKTQIPLSLHEDTIANLFTRDSVTGAVVEDDTLASLAAGLRSGRIAAEQIVAVVAALHADTTQTEGARAAKSRKLALEVAEAACKKIDASRIAAAAEIAEVESSMALPLPADEVELQIESEVRRALKNMPDADRAKIINDAINAGDDRTVAAVLRGPAWLTGDPAEIAMRRDQFFRKKFPAAVERLDRLRRAVEASDRGARALVSFVRNLAAAPGSAGAEAAAARASEAIAAAGATAKETV